MGFIPENVIVNLKKEIAASGGAAIEALTTRVQTLETTVGDETSGLVKDVDDLETVVGDSTSGLVKNVTDIMSAIMPDSLINSDLTFNNCSLVSGGYVVVGTFVFVTIRVNISADLKAASISGFPVYSGFGASNNVALAAYDHNYPATYVGAALLNNGTLNINANIDAAAVTVTGVYITKPAAIREDDQEENDLK